MIEPGFVTVQFRHVAILARFQLRAMPPLPILLLAADRIAWKNFATVQPIVRLKTDWSGLGVFPKWGFTIALVLAFALSLVERRRRRGA